MLFRSVATFCKVDNRRDVEIRFGEFGFAYTISLISKAMMQTAFINLRVNGNSTNAHPPCRSNDSDCNLSTIGYEKFFDHFEFQVG